MAQNINNDHAFQDAGNSNIILGTSSDAIIDGLHSGNFAEETATGDISADDDKDQIVNQQDQNEIVNPAEKDYENKDNVFTDTTPPQVTSFEPLYTDKTDKEISDDKIISGNGSDRLPAI